jgi:hypothetical protein
MNGNEIEKLGFKDMFALSMAIFQIVLPGLLITIVAALTSLLIIKCWL